MEGIKDRYAFLDLMIHPGFCVKEMIIVQVNQAAQALMIAPGTDVRTLLHTGREEYETFTTGSLYLKLHHGQQYFGASVSRAEDVDVFVLDRAADNSELQALALAAMELRQPLLNIMLSADHLPEDEENRIALSRMNRGLHQLHRIINNMSDAGRFASASHQEMRDVGMVFDEIMEKSQALAAQAGHALIWQGLDKESIALIDREQMERAVLNMLSNAMKFSPQGSRIEATLKQQGKLLQLSIQDSGCGIADQVLPHVYHRYLRQPGIEDSRFGLGLGMVLIRSAAANHGGTVLIDKPGKTGTRITMTMQLRQSNGNFVKAPIDLPGGLDVGLTELSDCLPASVYEK